MGQDIGFLTPKRWASTRSVVTYPLTQVSTNQVIGDQSGDSSTNNMIGRQSPDSLINHLNGDPFTPLPQHVSEWWLVHAAT